MKLLLHIGILIPCAVLFFQFMAINRLVETFYIHSPIILTSNQILENKNFCLDSNANCPVIIVGNIDGSPITNVTIRHVEINGMRANQTSEFWEIHTNGVITVSGIVIQNARNIHIENVKIYSCRSAGIVTSQFSSEIYIDNLTSVDNEFDGMACYETKNSFFHNLTLANNKAAGISVDSHFNSNLILDANLKDNSIGIFCRNSEFNCWEKLNLVDNKVGIFLAQIDDRPDTAARYNLFVSSKFNDEKFINCNPDSCVENQIFNSDK